jgi:hypothetical protein
LIVKYSKKMKTEAEELREIEELISHNPYEHYSDMVDIGGTQSNAGTLGLTQPERNKRFEKEIKPHVAPLHVTHEHGW